jgi:two-component system chemotaxis response regulator CheY
MAVDKNAPILIVDDYKTMLRIIRNLLQQIGFTEIDEATDGAAALDRIRSRSYQLVLTDWNMQPMTGLELLKKVREQEQTKKLPVILVTAESKAENIVAAKQAGVNNYIIKPFTAEVLKSKLVSVLGEF